jgi:hypothetical protein
MVFAYYPKYGIAFLVGLSNAPLGSKRYGMKSKRFLIYIKKGIAHP